MSGYDCQHKCAFSVRQNAVKDNRPTQRSRENRDHAAAASERSPDVEGMTDKRPKTRRRLLEMTSSRNVSNVKTDTTTFELWLNRPSYFTVTV